MRYYFIVTLSLILVIGCKQANPGSSTMNGVLIASVTETGNKPEAGKQIELVEKRDTMVTDISGRVVFVVAPGTYTIRAYGLNHGGPVLPFNDSMAVVKAGDTTRISFWDCPLCM